MSTRYSKTSSRGRSMVIESSMGSTTPQYYRRAIAGAPGPSAPARRAHELGRPGRLAAARPAQLAHDPLAVEVDPLADQRGAVAVDAAVARLRQRADALAQQRTLESR